LPKLPNAPINQWILLENISDLSPESQVLKWLAEKGSMTEKLKKAANGNLKVELLLSKELIATRSELSRLELPPMTKAYVREVLMSVDSDNWMFGRTIMPLETVNGNYGIKLKELGTQPLGSVLFDEDSTERVSIEIARITKDHALYPDDFLQNESTLWSRRSIFMFHNKPLLVQEVFLPKSPIESN